MDTAASTAAEQVALLRGLARQTDPRALPVSSRQRISWAQDTLPHDGSREIRISLLARGLEQLDRRLTAAGATDAADGLRSYVAYAARNPEDGDLNGVIRLGSAALGSEDHDFFTGLLGNFQAATDKGMLGGLPAAILREAAASFQALGLGAARALAETTETVLNLPITWSDPGSETQVLPLHSALGEFLAAWREIRSMDQPTTDRERISSRLATGIRAQADTAEAQSFTRTFRETLQRVQNLETATPTSAMAPAMPMSQRVASATP